MRLAVSNCFLSYSKFCSEKLLERSKLWCVRGAILCSYKTTATHLTCQPVTHCRLKCYVQILRSWAKNVSSVCKFSSFFYLVCLQIGNWDRQEKGDKPHLAMLCVNSCRTLFASALRAPCPCSWQLERSTCAAALTQIGHKRSESCNHNLFIINLKSNRICKVSAQGWVVPWWLSFMFLNFFQSHTNSYSWETFFCTMNMNTISYLEKPSKYSTSMPNRICQVSAQGWVVPWWLS